MKKICICFPIMVFASLLIIGCGEPKSDLFIGKWDMTNDPSSHFQRILELKDNNVFVETWIATSDDEDEEYVLEIQGEYFFEEAERSGKALCFIYDLESLSDPSGILEALEDESHFSEENKKYNDAKKQGDVYGLQGVSATPTRMYYDMDVEKAGQKIKETREFLRIKDDNEGTAFN